MAAANLSENPARDNRERSDRGIKFFSGLPVPHLTIAYPQAMSVSADQLRLGNNGENAVWRPEETVEAADILFKTGKVHIIGAPQSGKGTILFGLSEICSRKGWGYVFINGHHTDSPTEHLTGSIIRANSEGRAIFYDSFDYLWKVSTSVNSTKSQAQKARSGSIMNVLNQVSVPVAITSHDEIWARKFINLEFRSQFAQEIEAYPIYSLSNYLQSPESIAKFLMNNSLTPVQTTKLLSFEYNPHIVNALVHRYGDKDIVAAIFRALHSYPVLKDLTRDNRDEVTRLLDAMGITSQQDAGVAVQLADVIRSSDKFVPFLAALRKKK